VQSLERRLGLFSIIVISISSMVGSGIFVLPGIGFQITGPSIALAFFLAALTILPAAMSKAELATAMPTSGGTYVYIDRTFGPLAGTVSGLGLFLSILLKASFALVGLGAYFSVLSSYALMPTILVFLSVIIILNILGVGKVSSLLTISLGVTLFSLLILILFSSQQWDYHNLQPFMPNGLSGLASATGLVFVSFAGVTKVAAIAEEVKEPEKNLPRGILISLLVVTLLYFAVSFTLGGVFSAQEIAGEIKPIHTLAAKIGSPLVATFIALIAVLTMVNTSNAGVLAGSRFPFAMSRDRLFPKFLGRLHPRFLTPVASILLSGAIIAVVLLTLNVEKIAKLASAFMIMIYMVENLCVVVLRETRPQWYNPGYKAPLYPFLQVIGLISGGALLYAMGKISAIAIVSIAIPGVIFYFIYARSKTQRVGVIGMKGKRHDLIEDTFQRHANFYDIKRHSEVVVSLFGNERSADMLIEMGMAMAENNHVEAAFILEVPEQTTLQDVIEEPAEVRSLRRRVDAMAQEKNTPISFDPVVSHDVSKSIYEISQCVHCRWLLVEWRGRNRGALTVHNPIGWLKSHLQCNLAIFKDKGVRYIRNIMVLLKDDYNDKIVLETADHLASVNKADVTLMQHIPKNVSTDSQDKIFENLKELSHELDAFTKVKLLTGPNDIEDIVAQTVEYDLFIMGSEDHSWKESFFGSKDDRIIARASCSVMAVHVDAFNRKKKE
jgi:APA family basic amino acid/polyamine antiporter